MQLSILTISLFHGFLQTSNKTMFKCLKGFCPLDSTVKKLWKEWGKRLICKPVSHVFIRLTLFILSDQIIFRQNLEFRVLCIFLSHMQNRNQITLLLLFRGTGVFGKTWHYFHCLGCLDISNTANSKTYFFSFFFLRCNSFKVKIFPCNQNEADFFDHMAGKK